MANINYIPYAQQMANVERQRKYAQLLQEQGAAPLESQQVSGIVVPTSPWLGLTKMLQAGLGGYLEGKAAKREGKLDTQQREEAKKSIQDFMTASGPQKAYESTPVMEQISDEDRTEMGPKMQWSDETGQMEPVQSWKETLKPGLSRNEQIAKLLEMQAGGNKYVSAAVPTLTGLMPQQEEYGTPFESGGKMYAMTKQGTIKDLNLAAPTKEAKALPSAVQEYEYAVRQGFKGTLADYERQKAINVNVPAAETYGGLTPVIDPKTGQTIYVRPGSKGSIQEVSEYKPPAAQAPEAFHEKNLDLQNASGNFSNFRTVLNTINKAGGIYGESAGQLASAFKLAQNSIRKLQGTGVLNIGELPFLEQALSDPQGFMSLADPTSRQKILGQLDQLDKALQRQKESLYEEYKQPLAQDKTSTTSSSGETAAQRAKRLGI